VRAKVIAHVRERQKENRRRHAPAHSLNIHLTHNHTLKTPHSLSNIHARTQHIHTHTQIEKHTHTHTHTYIHTQLYTHQHTHTHAHTLTHTHTHTRTCTHTHAHTRIHTHIIRTNVLMHMDEYVRERSQNLT